MWFLNKAELIAFTCELFLIKPLFSCELGRRKERWSGQCWRKQKKRHRRNRRVAPPRKLPLSFSLYLWISQRIEALVVFLHFQHFISLPPSLPPLSIFLPFFSRRFAFFLTTATAAILTQPLPHFVFTFFFFYHRFNSYIYKYQ